MNRMLILLALACTAAGAAADKQQVYKWTDASGVVHFTDLPPPKDTPNVQSVRMIGGGTTTAPTADAAKPTAPAATTASAASTPANGQPDEATLCKQARANLELLQGKTPVGIAGADGKAEVLDDKERDGQIANAKLAIARFCK